MADSKGSACSRGMAGEKQRHWLVKTGSPGPAGLYTDDRLKWRNSVLEKQLFQILSS